MKLKQKTIGILEMLLASTIRGASQSTFAKIIETPIFNLTFEISSWQWIEAH